MVRFQIYLKYYILWDFLYKTGALILEYLGYQQ